MNEAIGFGSIDQPVFKPPKFPMKFREFLRRAFGGRLHGDRLHMFRKFLKSEYSYGNPDVPTSLISKISEAGIRDQDTYYGFVGQIKQWRAVNRLQQRKAAGQTRWLKESRKKLLTVLQKRINALSQTEKCSLASRKVKKVAGSHLEK